jgi:DNA-binding IclR family transcriptional regulator
MTESTHHIKSLFTTFRIIDALQGRGSMRVVQIAQETGIRKSSVFKHLDTLHQLGYVTKSETEYSLSLQWFTIGQQVRTRYEIVDTARPKLDQFALQTGETVSLVVQEDEDAVYLYQTSDGERVSPVAEGERLPCQFSVGGKAILAYRPEAELKRRLDEMDLEEDHSERLFEELIGLRDQRLVVELSTPQTENISAGDILGHSHVSGDHDRYRDIHSVAVPVRNEQGDAVAAIEVSGAEPSLTRNRLEEEIASRLVELGESLEVALLHTEDRIEV